MNVLEIMQLGDEHALGRRVRFGLFHHGQMFV